MFYYLLIARSNEFSLWHFHSSITVFYSPPNIDSLEHFCASKILEKMKYKLIEVC